MKPLPDGVMSSASGQPQLELMEQWLSLLSDTEKTLVLRHLIKHIPASQSQFLLSVWGDHERLNSCLSCLFFSRFFLLIPASALLIWGSSPLDETHTCVY